MTREEHLTFCKKCHNRKFDSQQGLVCKLTDQVADFEGDCENFSLDESVKETIRVEDKNASEIIAELPVEIIDKLRPHQDLGYAIIGGAFLSVICALIWAIITVAIEYQIGYMAIGVGLLAGLGVRFFGAGVDPIFGIIGAITALLGCLLGNLFSQVGFIAQAEGLGYFQTMTFLNLDNIIMIYTESFSAIDLLFYGIATYEGFKFAFRTIPEDIADLQDFSPPYAQLRMPAAIVAFVAIAVMGFML